VICKSAGHVYGTTVNGGPANAGVVFRLEGQDETVLYSFTGGADGNLPAAGVIQDPAGNLYGTTFAGGAFGSGVVFKLDPSGHETVLYSFTGGRDGGMPGLAGVVQDSAGNLYGTTFTGGAFDSGVVYKVDQSGHETVLYTFTGGVDGGSPQGGVILDSAGNLYGTAAGGGAFGSGVVFKLDADGHETILYSFTGSGGDGAGPVAGVIQDPAGNLYGTTFIGGLFPEICPAGCGVVYKVDPSGRETVLHAFTGGIDGSLPEAGVIRDATGHLYGTTTVGGAFGAGVVYKIIPGGAIDNIFLPSL
jgi:uncharacterized repeat protein (TIGR03803 family)